MKIQLDHLKGTLLPPGAHWHFQPVQIGDEVIYLPPMATSSGRKEEKTMFMRDPGDQSDDWSGWNDWDDIAARELGNLPGSDN